MIAQLERIDFEPPQYLVVPLYKCRRDEIRELEQAGYQIVTSTLRGWLPYTHIIASHGNTYLATIS